LGLGERGKGDRRLSWDGRPTIAKGTGGTRILGGLSPLGLRLLSVEGRIGILRKGAEALRGGSIDVLKKGQTKEETPFFLNGKREGCRQGKRVALTGPSKEGKTDQQSLITGCNPFLNAKVSSIDSRRSRPLAFKGPPF